jgi:uncharacterized membrane protein
MLNFHAHVTRSRESTWTTAGRSGSRTRHIEQTGFLAFLLIIWRLVRFIIIVASAVLTLAGVFSGLLFAGILVAITLGSMVARFYAL